MSFFRRCKPYNFNTQIKTEINCIWLLFFFWLIFTSDRKITVKRTSDGV